MSIQNSTSVLLINLGTPDSPRPWDVYRYLTQFLNDPRVIDISWLARFLLVNLIIVPFRHRKTAGLYKKLWSTKGSPLLHWGRRTETLLTERFIGESVSVHLAMRYGSPSIQQTLAQVLPANPQNLIVIPLFPQFASASTGSAIDELMKHLSRSHIIPNLHVLACFYNHPSYIRAVQQTAAEIEYNNHDHVLFSFHGLPERQLDQIYKDRKCSNHACETEINNENIYCYKAQCYSTARSVAQVLGIASQKYTVCFQSRLGSGWIEPFTDKVIINLAKNGAKKLLVFSPSFVADCLETTIEIGEEYKGLFEAHGGETLETVPSLNDTGPWIDALEHMIRARLT